MKLLLIALFVLSAWGQKLQPTGPWNSPLRVTAHNGSYAIVANDMVGNSQLTTNTAAAWTLPQAGTTGFEAAKWFDANNIGSGALTITATTSTFSGCGSSGSVLTVAAGASARIVSSGGNYVVSGCGGGGGTTYTADGVTLQLIGSQFSAITGVMATRTGPSGQSGQDTTITASSSSPTVYVGAPAGGVALTAYTDGMRLLFKFNVSCTGGTATTLNVSGLGAKRIYQYDGSTDPTSAQCGAGQQVTLSYDTALNSSAGAFRMQSGGGGGSSSPLTTKGDIYTHNSTVDARLGVGTNGQILVANSAATNGINWGSWTPTPTAGIILPYGGMDNVNNSTFGTVTHQSAFFPIVIPYPGLIVGHIGTYVQTDGSYVQFGIYDAATCTLQGSSTPINTHNSGSNEFTVTFATPVPLQPGQYFLGVTADGTSTLMKAAVSDGYGLSVPTMNTVSASPNVFTGTASTGTAGSLQLPSTCGSRSALGAGTKIPYISMGS